jgi:hypothetical protein
MKRVLVAILLFVPIVFAQEAPKTKLSDAELTARTDKRRAMQWYVIEPMTPCIAGSAKRIREQGEDPLGVRHGRYKSRLEAATFEELTGLDSKLTDGLDPLLKEVLKRQFVSDLLAVHQRGACKEDASN